MLMQVHEKGKVSIFTLVASLVIASITFHGEIRVVSTLALAALVKTIMLMSKYQLLKAVYTTGKLCTDSSKKLYGPHNFSRLYWSDKKWPKDQVWEVAFTLHFLGDRTNI